MDREFFEQIISALDSPLYVTDTDGRILYVNAAFETVSRYRREELIGQKTSIIKSGKMPDSYYQRLWKTILSGKTWKEEIINRRKDGSEYTVLQYVTPVADKNGQNKYFAAVQYDITREKNLQDEREIFFDVSVDLFCIMDKDGLFKQTNGAWKNVLGWDGEHLAGSQFADLIHPGDRDIFADYRDRLLESGEISPIDVRLSAGNGEYRWVSWRMYFYEERRLFYASGRDIQKRVEMEEAIRTISVTDALTGTYNRMKFNDELEKELVRSERYTTPASLILFDIDHFKKVNDTYGHGTGDTVLKTLAGLVNSQLRETDILCRWGGEEFVIICPNTGIDAAFALSERIRKTVESHSFADAGRVTISTGVGAFRPGEDRSETLLQRVDEALYTAKNQGRNRTVSAE